MGFFKRLFCKKIDDSNVGRSVASNNPTLRENSEIYYYIYLDAVVFGPFTLSELKNDYPILKDTLITTDTLNGEWYEAQCFECFDALFNVRQDFRINEFGEIIRYK
jgi:hypothetical protein